MAAFYSWPAPNGSADFSGFFYEFSIGQGEQDLAAWEMNLRFLGLMAFMGGLVERVLTALTKKDD